MPRTTRNGYSDVITVFSRSEHSFIRWKDHTWPTLELALENDLDDEAASGEKRATDTRLKHDRAPDRVSRVEGVFEKLQELAREVMTLVLQIAEEWIATILW